MIISHLLLVSMVLQSELLFVDYGNSEVKPDCELVEIPPRLSMPKPYAQKYILYGLQPVHNDPGTIGYQQVTMMCTFTRCTIMNTTAGYTISIATTGKSSVSFCVQYIMDL